MKVARAAVSIAGLLSLAGCHTAKTVAVSTFKVIDAPANYMRHRIEPDQTTTTTTTTSDVTTPGRPVQATNATGSTQRRNSADTRAPDRTAASTTTTRSSNAPSTATPRTSSAQQQPQFPTAKAVPGKAGYVYSPYDPNGGYVDVTGYASGSKAKDPYSGKIFIVP